MVIEHKINVENTLSYIKAMKGYYGEEKEKK